MQSIPHIADIRIEVPGKYWTPPSSGIRFGYLSAHRFSALLRFESACRDVSRQSTFKFAIENMFFGRRVKRYNLR
jgi:hypothetical protein